MFTDTVLPSENLDCNADAAVAVAVSFPAVPAVVDNLSDPAFDASDRAFLMNEEVLLGCVTVSLVDGLINDTSLLTASFSVGEQLSWC